MAPRASMSGSFDHLMSLDVANQDWSLVSPADSGLPMACGKHGTLFLLIAVGILLISPANARHLNHQRRRSMHHHRHKKARAKAVPMPQKIGVGMEVKSGESGAEQHASQAQETIAMGDLGGDGSCGDLTAYCASWGMQYCGPGWMLEGQPVSTYWCKRTCRKCSDVPDQGGNPNGGLASANGGDYHSQLLALVNQGRAENGAPSLCLNPKLNRAALSHSQDMNDRKFFSHVGSNGLSFSDRMEREGYAAAAGWRAENLASGQQSAQEVYDAWKASPSHWVHMIKSVYLHMGIGMVNNIWTQDFGSTPTESCM